MIDDNDFEDEYPVEVRRVNLPADDEVRVEVRRARLPGERDEVVEVERVYVPVEEEPDRWRSDRAGKAMLIVLGSLLLVTALAVLGVRWLGGTQVTTTEVVATPAPPVEPTAALQLDPLVTLEPVVVAPFEPSPVTITTVPRPPITMEQPASLISGILHGLISPVTFVLSLVAPTIRMYDLTNSGPLYDAGFLIGVLMLLAVLRWRTGRRWIFA